MVMSEDPELTSSHGPNQSTTTFGIIPLERDLETRWTEPLQESVKGQNWDTLKRQRDDLAKGKAYPNCGDSQSKMITPQRSLLWRLRDSNSISGTPTSRSYTGEISLQNNWLWKPMRYTLRKVRKLQGLEKPTLKCLVCKFTQPLKPVSVQFGSFQFSTVAQSCPTICDPMNRSTPSLPVHHQLLEFTQTHFHRVGDAIQPSHPLSSPSLLAFSLFQHQDLFQWVSPSHQVAKVLEFQLQPQSFQWTPRTDLL